MEALQVLVRNLIMILILATVLELLLPNKSMRGFVQLVMGLFVISALLNPLTQWLKMPLEMEIPAWSATQTEDMPALAQDGGAEEDVGRTAVQEQYRKILANQIQAIALTVKGVETAKADVEFAEEVKKITDQPQIAKVKVALTFASDAGNINAVEPVVIDSFSSDSAAKEKEEKQGTSAHAEQIKEVKEKLSALMNLSSEIVDVTEVK